MGLDLQMVRTPYDVADHYPESIREGYFRGAPKEVMEYAGIFDNDMQWPDEPEWPPAGLSKERSESLLDFFETFHDDWETSRPVPGADLVALEPTFSELRIMQSYLQERGRSLSATSSTPAKCLGTSSAVMTAGM
ncbi:hypothetical protein ACFL0Q_01235 [Thermodesulfobacteriota bacterium]